MCFYNTVMFVSNNTEGGITMLKKCIIYFCLMIMITISSVGAVNFS